MTRSIGSRDASRRTRAKDRLPAAPASANETIITAAGKSSIAAETIENSTINTGNQYPINLVLDKVVYERLREQDYLPMLYTTIAISLTTDVARRFFGGDGQWLGLAAGTAHYVFLVLAAVAVALTISSLLRPTHPIAKKAAVVGALRKRSRLKKTTVITVTAFGKSFSVKRTVVITGLAFSIAVGLRLSLPIFAHVYNERGIQLQYGEPPDLSGAREAYERAVRLTPGYAPAHYNLASVYEELHNEKAMEEYRLAINYDSRIYPAYNNLARLYLLRGKENDYESALTILSQASELSPQDENVRYSLNKNLGWANYELKHYPLAEIYLRKAISLRGENGAAAAHCLLAYVLKEQGKAGVGDEVFDCVSLAPGEKDVEGKWLSDAQEYMMRGGGK